MAHQVPGKDGAHRPAAWEYAAVEGRVGGAAVGVHGQRRHAGDHAGYVKPDIASVTCAVRNSLRVCNTLSESS